jgi:hypothetical protein
MDRADPAARSLEKMMAAADPPVFYIKANKSWAVYHGNPDSGEGKKLRPRSKRQQQKYSYDSRETDGLAWSRRNGKRYSYLLSLFLSFFHYYLF